MAHDQEMENSFGFKTIRLFKDQPLGSGSYGKVYRAKCDDLPCAAKLIHDILFTNLDATSQAAQAPTTEKGLPTWRFEQECQLLSTIRHPNIVQYLGIYHDPDTGLPALLMELMDDNLTHFLECSTQPIPYHIQVNICYDIALALSFLHSNDIIHRDLSSNNVLLIGNVKAKVTDFGMARLGDQNPRASHLTFTMCPGTDVFMPPEAVREEPVYTEKIDCFSFGVITLQMVTQKFPKPGKRRQEIELNNPDLPCGTYERIVLETERRQNHISKVDSNHTLLQIILDCLKDKDSERPTAQELCDRLETIIEREELRSLRRKFEESLQEKDQQLKQREDDICQLKKEKDEAIEKRGKLEREKDEEIKRLEKELHEMKEQLKKENEQATEAQSQADTATSGEEQNTKKIKMIWEDGPEALCPMSNVYGNNTVESDGSSLYFRKSEREKIFYTCTCTTSPFTWSQLPDSPTFYSPSVIVNNMLTVVGGYGHSGTTNQLFSLTGSGNDRKWTEHFPPMLSKRSNSIALCKGTALIVAGGDTPVDGTTRAVAVMNTETHQWSTVADLPYPLSRGSGVICGDNLYILKSDYSSLAYTCPTSVLIRSCRSRSTVGIWNKITIPPVTWTCYVSFQDQLLSVGGRPNGNACTPLVYMYSPSTNSWEDIGNMSIARCNCFAGVLPNNQLMVVGGTNSSGNATASVEIATIELC